LGTQNHYERIRNSLEELRSALEPYVEERMRAAFGDDWQAHYAIPGWPDYEFNADVQVLTNTIVNNWEDVFAREMKREAKHLVHQVRKTRNRFAHQERFDESDTYTALHEMQRLLEAIGSESAQAIERAKNEMVPDMAGAGHSPEAIEAAADDALAKGASQPVLQARLVKLQRGQPTQVEYLLEPPTVIGRADARTGQIDVDLTDHDDAAYVSRQHAKIVQEGGVFVLEDLGSSNGTFVKRGEYEKVERTELSDGDEVAFGNAKFVFRTEA
jgi:hypothetical protein